MNTTTKAAANLTDNDMIVIRPETEFGRFVTTIQINKLERKPSFKLAALCSELCSIYHDARYAMKAINPVHLPLDVRKEFRGLSIQGAYEAEHEKYGTVYCVMFCDRPVWFRCTGKFWSEFDPNQETK